MSTIGFIDQDEFEILLQSVIGSISFSDSDKTLISQCLTEAYNIIISELMGRGITTDQINSWQRRTEYQNNIAIYLYAKYTGRLGSEEDVNKFSQYNKIDELKTVIVVTSVKDENGLETITIVDNGGFEPQIINLIEVNRNLFIASQTESQG
jgi:hypothetical protein